MTSEILKAMMDDAVKADLKLINARIQEAFDLGKKEAKKETMDLTLELAIALQEAWPYVHQSCTIDSKKKTISEAMKKVHKYHGGS